MTGQALNFSKISREIGIDPKTIKEYFQILEDTLVGFWVPGYHQSVRKAQKIQPKFYLFDVGVRRALEGSLDSPPVPGTSLYRNYFEHFVITEIFRYNSYSGLNFKMSTYQLATGGEIDLILSKGFKKIVVEIKSTTSIDPAEVKKYAQLAQAFETSQKYLISQDPIASEVHGIRCLHLKDFLKEIFRTLT